ncbi:chorismate mutase [Jeotgalibacillus campisalis]|uniref:chorismate mutase n=1 Tax=Jeotgalibacillus campisalis TaxID=220754 RepID=A0A0C2VVR1_9BACL|nr:chorismate mutase [Jeotgalibacillus campisalis]KIL48058.1 chorismate mutase [Jeotgalibacillus campisalis]
MIRGIRGATTITADQEEFVLAATQRLLEEMIEKNKVDPESVASVFISVTPDISSAFPAKAIRRFKHWRHVPVMCMQEIPVDESLPFCVRVMMHVNTVKPQKEIHHVYQEKAIKLRPDLTMEDKS